MGAGGPVSRLRRAAATLVVVGCLAGVSPPDARAATRALVSRRCAEEDGSAGADRAGCWWDDGRGLRYVVLRGRKPVFLFRGPAGVVTRRYPLVVVEAGRVVTVRHRGVLVGGNGVWT